MSADPLQAGDKVVVFEDDAALVVVRRGNGFKLADRFANEPDLNTCHRCRQKVPGVKDRSGGGNMLCYRCAEAMTDFWMLHERPNNVPDSLAGMMADERYKTYLRGYEIPAER